MKKRKSIVRDFILQDVYKRQGIQRGFVGAAVGDWQGALSAATRAGYRKKMCIRDRYIACPNFSYKNWYAHIKWQGIDKSVKRL